MKRYLWTAVAVLFVNANASENPFALKENLLKIDNDQEMLLSELRKLAEAREDAQLDAEDDDIALEEDSKEDIVEDASAKMEDSQEQYNLTKSIDELMGEGTQEEEKTEVESAQEEEPVSTAIVDEARKRAMEKAAQEAKKAEEAALKLAQEKAEKEKAVQAEVKAAQAQAQQEAESKAKLAQEAREAEKREVAAYEKQRAEKLAQKAKENKKPYTAKQWEAEHGHGINLEAEQKAARATAEVSYENAVLEMGGSAQSDTAKPAAEKKEMAEGKSVEKPSVAHGDIDVESEKIAAQKAADAAYLEAVREMDQEED